MGRAPGALSWARGCSDGPRVRAGLGKPRPRRGGEGESGPGSTAVILGSPAHLGEDGERLVWKSLSGESLTSQGARSSYWMSEHPGFSSCGFSQAPSLILHPTLSSIPAFLRFLPLASAYRCDFGCVLDLFRICFSHWLAMFAFLIILFPTSCVVSCIQQMFKMFL